MSEEMSDIWEMYGYKAPKEQVPHGQAIFEASVNCFAYNTKQNRCKVLNRTWCRHELCKFFKTEEQYQLDLIRSMRCKR